MLLQKTKIGLLAIVLLTSTVACSQIIAPPNTDNLSKNTSIPQKVNALLATMSLEDKVGEMTQLSLDMIAVGQPYALEEPHRLDEEKMRKVLVDLRVGSILNNGGHAQTRAFWQHTIKEIQDMAMNEKASGIPVLYGIDAIHGANYTVGATLFPQQINLAATWDTDLVQELAGISAYETKASSIPWAFAPVLDVGRDPRWSRFWETFGEDVFLVSKMGKAVIEGIQGEDVAGTYHAAACMKHFIGYSMPLTGKDRTPSWIPERQLREYFIPSFQAAIDAGAKTVMINSGEINGIPVHANPGILIDLLRGELGFKGITVTDWEDIKYLYTRHRIATDYKDAIRIAINAGIDMSMVPVDLEYTRLLKELVKEGKVPMARIDESVSRILTLKYELGLFETPYPNFDAYPSFNSTEFQSKALLAAMESLVLLKNQDNTLPLDYDKKILITGPTAHSLNAINGAWTGTWQGLDEKYNTQGELTIYQALVDKYGDDYVQYIEGTSIHETINIPAAVAAAKEVDIAIICLGEMPYVEKPGDIHDLNLPVAQQALVKAIAATGTPIVLVLVEGRPRIVQSIEPLADAVIWAGLPGDKGGKALAAIISGEFNPSGKLPFTYPRFANDLIPYDHKGTELIDPDFGINAFNPQWAFGHGLSYSAFKYENLSVSEQNGKKIIISVDVTNTGEGFGEETVLLFITDKTASITPSVKRLRGFDKIDLPSGTKKTVTFSLTTDDLKFVGIDNKWIFEQGAFIISVGGLSESVTLK